MFAYVLKRALFSFTGVVTLITALVLNTQSTHAHQSGIEALLGEKVRLVHEMNETAKAALLEGIKKPEIEAYFSARNADQKEKHKHEIDKHALAISNKFGADEVCLIDAFGSEVSRVFHNHIAQDLSDAEGQASFFRGGIATEPGEVFITAPYISGDTHEWVTAYTTPIASPSGQTWGILHLERSLKVLQELLYGGFSDERHFIVAIDEGGWILADSRKDIDIKRNGEKIYPGDYFERFVLSGVDHNVLTHGKSKGGGDIDNPDGAYIYTFERIGPITLFAFEEKY